MIQIRILPLPSFLHFFRFNNKSIHHLKLTPSTKTTTTTTTATECEPTTSATTKKYTYLDLFRNCKVSLMVLALSFCWYSLALMFFGVVFEAQNLGKLLLTLTNPVIHWIPIYVYTILVYCNIQ